MLLYSRYGLGRGTEKISRVLQMWLHGINIHKNASSYTLKIHLLYAIFMSLKKTKIDMFESKSCVSFTSIIFGTSHGALYFGHSKNLMGLMTWSLECLFKEKVPCAWREMLTVDKVARQGYEIMQLFNPQGLQKSF